MLAAGGFANDIERRKALFPRTPTGHEHLALPPLGVSGDGLRLGESAGARVNTDLASPVAWAPVSQVPHKDGSIGHFPHIIERGKPGIIGVLSNGQRFVNEANGYYDYVTAMVAAAPKAKQSPPGWSALMAFSGVMAWVSLGRFRCRCHPLSAAAI